jgi:hypothetical protein
MCQRCVELKEKVAHYGSLLRYVSDVEKVEFLGPLIAEFQAQMYSHHFESICDNTPSGHSSL